MTETIMMNNVKNGVINTYSGLLIDLLNPTVDMIDIEDIARGLAFKGHFGGQTPFYFSIAQHSVLVQNLMIEDYFGNTKMLLLGLLHDASEAYIGDMVKPLKVHMSEFCEVEGVLMEVICEKYGLDYTAIDEVKSYDKLAQRMEFKTFFEGASLVGPISPEDSIKVFLETFNFLY